MNGFPSDQHAAAIGDANPRAPIQAAAVNTSAKASSPSIFQRKTAELPADTASLSFESLEDARSKFHRRSLIKNSADCLTSFKARHQEFVWKIMRAIDNHQYLEPQCRGGRDLTAGEMDAWKEWQKRAHEQARNVLDKDLKHRLLEVWAWEIVDKIREIHEIGYRRDQATEDGISSCLERVKIIILHLEKFTIIRRWAVVDMNYDQFITNPVEYAKLKVDSMWNAYTRSVASAKRSKGPTAGKKRSRNEIENVEEEAIDAVSAGPAKKATRLMTTSGDSKTPMLSNKEISKATKPRRESRRCLMSLNDDEVSSFDLSMLANNPSGGVEDASLSEITGLDGHGIASTVATDPSLHAQRTTSEMQVLSRLTEIAAQDG